MTTEHEKPAKKELPWLGIGTALAAIVAPRSAVSGLCCSYRLA